jgi:hypothetical protein
LKKWFDGFAHGNCAFDGNKIIVPGEWQIALPIGCDRPVAGRCLNTGG